MKTLVLKAQEVVADDNLRGMNELRMKCISTGTGAGRTNIKPFQSDGTYKGSIQYRVLSGGGTLTDVSGVNKGIEYNVQNLAGVIVPSGESIIQIKNFDLMTDVIGYNGGVFASTPTGNNPDVIINTKDLKYKTFLKQINLASDINASQYCFIDGEDIGDFANLTELTYLKARLYTHKSMGGKLSSLNNLKKLAYLHMANHNHCYADNFVYCIDDLIAMTALVDCEINGGTFTGGDIYGLLKNKSSVNFILSRAAQKTQDITCSYISGTSSIPTFTFTKLSLFDSGSIKVVTLNAAKAILTLFKDGITANKITLASGASIYFGMTESADSELTALAAEVTALGVDVHLQ